MVEPRLHPWAGSLGPSLMQTRGGGSQHVAIGGTAFTLLMTIPLIPSTVLGPFHETAFFVPIIRLGQMDQQLKREEEEEEGQRLGKEV